MTRRGLILISTLFGLFALSFGVLGVRALTLGPDPAQPTATELATRTSAANDLERKIAAAKADVPPALPAVPERIPMPAAQSGGAGSAAGAPQAPARAPVTQGYAYEEGDEYEDGEHDDEYEHEEGDDDDD
jgi:hypothetical protein